MDTGRVFMIPSLNSLLYQQVLDNVKGSICVYIKTDDPILLLGSAKHTTFQLNSCGEYTTN